jgi:hypothetical protein
MTPHHTRPGLSAALALLAGCVTLCPGCRPVASLPAVDVGAIAPGRLEFRIVANEHDDKLGISAACRYFIKAREDARLREELDARARAGKPPPPPVPDEGDTFATELGRYTYAWVELGRPERISLGLDAPPAESSATPRRPRSGLSSDPHAPPPLPEPEPDPAAEAAEFRRQKRAERQRRVAEGRAQNAPCDLPDMEGAVLYARKCQDESLSERERAEKGDDYFLLLRNPADANEMVGGEHLVKAYRSQDGGRLAINIVLDREGGERFYRLTSQNAPREGVYRFLAVLFDDRIVSVPRLNGKIRAEATITGDFTPAEVDRYVRLLRAGSGR